jgi:hypothetical protein
VSFPSAFIGNPEQIKNSRYQAGNNEREKVETVESPLEDRSYRKSQPYWKDLFEGFYSGFPPDTGIRGQAGSLGNDSLCGTV